MSLKLEAANFKSLRKHRAAVVNLPPPWKQLNYVNKPFNVKRKWNHTMAMKNAFVVVRVRHSLVLKSSGD